MKSEVEKSLSLAASALGIEAGPFELEYPENPEHGDFSSNIALIHAKSLGLKPFDLAQKISAEISKNIPACVGSLFVAGPGFINFKLKPDVIARQAIETRLDDGKKLSENKKKRTVMVEYTDPNPFKIFHIGHLMANAIGESVARLEEYSGAKVIRACYQGDVGLHVAKTIWAIGKSGQKIEDLSGTLVQKVAWLGEMYIEGSKHDDDEASMAEIKEINRKIFDKSDEEVNKTYDLGRSWSLDYLGTIYDRLGTKFDRFFFESEVDEIGMKVVNEFLMKGIFTKSDGAIVFKGEDHGLHTRVFITSQGLPTYEAKEIGLNIQKFDLYPNLDESLVITASEQNDYFDVLLKVLSITHPNIAEKTRHFGHGMMRFQSGKMSSRKGNIISAETLIDDMKALVVAKMSDRDLPPADVNEISDDVAIAAIKYTILRQSIGGDVIFDSARSISFEGDSGPYLQYSAVRARSVLEKARSEGYLSAKKPSEIKLPQKIGILERLMIRFDDVASRAASEYAPQQIAGYLINLAGAFNSFYAGNTIVDKNDPEAPYRIALTQAFLATVTEGLSLLGIKVPKKM